MARGTSNIGSEPLDVLVLGDHPAGYVAAAALGGKGSKLRVGLAPLPDPQPDDRLVTLNPALFDLHPVLAAARADVPVTAVHGAKFLSDDGKTAATYDPGKKAVIYTARYRDVRQAVAKQAVARQAAAEGVEVLAAGAVQVRRADETGVDVTVGKRTVRTTAIVLAGTLPAEQLAVLNMPDGWGADVLHRFTSVRCKSGKYLTIPDRPLLPMSLDLSGQLCWGWLIPGDGEFQLSVEHPVAGPPAVAGIALLRHWIGVLQQHGFLAKKFDVGDDQVRSVDLPLAGALAHEGVGNRTLLVGPAGGFLSACGEDIYPGCWSAVYAADVLRKALKETHLQDALGAYRQKWRVTLGDYLRGPQQNLRFLLPLVYRNAVMTARLAEAILLSKSVVR